MTDSFDYDVFLSYAGKDRARARGLAEELRDAGLDNKPSGKKIYVQLKSGDSHLRQRQRDRKLIFDVKKPGHPERDEKSS